jgi:hypothetical protein
VDIIEADDMVELEKLEGNVLHHSIIGDTWSPASDLVS